MRYVTFLGKIFILKKSRRSWASFYSKYMYMYTFIIQILVAFLTHVYRNNCLLKFTSFDTLLFCPLLMRLVAISIFFTYMSVKLRHTTNIFENKIKNWKLRFFDVQFHHEYRKRNISRRSRLRNGIVLTKKVHTERKSLWKW